MTADFLRYMGVNEVIIQALEKTCKNSMDELEILQDNTCLRVLVKNADARHGRMPLLTITDFFNTESQKLHVRSKKEMPSQEYGCRDIIEFLQDQGEHKPNLKINHAPLHLSDSRYRLLMHLAKAIKTDKDGWVFVQDLKDKGILTGGDYQCFSRLRNFIAGYLLEKNPRQFIESNGRKQYRLSINPKNISFEKGK